MSQNRETLDAQMVVWIVFFIVILFVVPAVYAAHAGLINGKLLALAKLQLMPFIRFSDEAHAALIRMSAVEPSSLTWENMQGILRYVGTWLRWPCAVLLGVLGVLSFYMGKTGKLTRRLSMDSLLAHNAESFACLRPVVGKGKELLSPDSYDTGLWRIALSPVQFAVENGLLHDAEGKVFTTNDVLRNGLAHTDVIAYGNAHLHEERAKDVLQEQLGKPFKGFDTLALHKKALASAFLAYAAGDKQVCMQILDALSSAYVETDGVASCPLAEDERFQKYIVATFQKYAPVLKDKLMQRHESFELVWFMALLTLARKKGVLASSQFLFLRPLDRPLWYALNQCGGRAAWAEGLSAWSHFYAEETVGTTLKEGHISQAVKCLKEMLAHQGWFSDVPVELVSSAAEISDDVVFCPAEESVDDGDDDTGYSAPEHDDPDYDAHNDENLSKELY